MSNCFGCNHFIVSKEECFQGHPVKWVSGIGYRSLSSSDYGEIDCPHFVKWVDFGIVSDSTPSYRTVQRYRSVSRNRRGNTKKKTCVLCGYHVCRCGTRIGSVLNDG